MIFTLLPDGETLTRGTLDGHPFPSRRLDLHIWVGLITDRVSISVSLPLLLVKGPDGNLSYGFV